MHQFRVLIEQSMVQFSHILQEIRKCGVNYQKNFPNT